MVKSIVNSKIAAIILTLFLGTCLIFSPPIDADFGWHYRYGEEITQSIISRDFSNWGKNTFSFTFPEYRWANSYWLSQIIIFNIGETMSITGLSIILSLLVLGFAALLFSKNIKTQQQRATFTAREIML